ncbi:Bug family tripartite tricarboxylate transporter substrate binding protein [Aquabacter sp. P-9]|uniref:Bug family tripartite tricarboxylate transporter substrate binding protein n=1 Tax=Aquabacter sediminis TaxID=3029197 RepID=UPI00237E2AC7|nr:tripartite tricarboxylate transporter substrate binding protein [Aquabacter sp. P-9]MDE1570949.1 tripartite tricarboxylate transporter substrate binding protein [Aquabacter sp. P-9]
MDRRHFLKGIAALPALAGTAGLSATPAFAQAPWPSRAITMIVPFPPGGQADLAARPVANALNTILGQPVVVENKGGAGGAIGNGQAAKAAPDGYTMLMTLSSVAVLPEAARISGRTSSYEMNQLQPLARVLADPTVLVVPASAPWKSVAELVADAKANPGKITYGSSGLYGTLHVSMAMFTTAAGIDMLHVPYQGGGPALTALVGGQVQALASAPGPLKPFQDKLRVLACFGAKRAEAYPDVPTFQELGYKDVEFYIWAGLFLPVGVPKPVQEKLGAAVKTAVQSPDVVRILENAGSPPAYLDEAQFTAFVAADSARLVKAVQAIGKVE